MWCLKHVRSPEQFFCVVQGGVTPLISAACYGNADAIQALLDAGADRFAEVMVLRLFCVWGIAATVGDTGRAS